MPPPRTGSVEPFRRANGTTYYRARLRLGDGTRARVDVPEKYSRPAGGTTGQERAELYAAAAQEREDEMGELLGKKRARAAEEAKKHSSTHGETCEKYFRRFVDHRKAIGRVRRARDLESSWSVWISPKLGSKPIAGITRDDVEDVRDALDVAVAKRKKEGAKAGLSGARARNVWSVLTSMMKEACTSKRRELRVRDDNPCSTVQPPDRTDTKAKTFIYPNEFLRLAACAQVPRSWRELYAVACYLYMRPGELRALLWTDVDFEAGVVHITKAYDEDSKTVKAPKTRNGVRDVPIPATLVPLLETMYEKAKRSGVAPVLPLMEALNENRRAQWMREHFTIAKLDRARLTEETSTTMQVNFRSWRDTGITWLALQGVDVAKMQRRAGHDAISTTLGYVKMAEDLTGTIGEPFPPLPSPLLEDSGGGAAGGGRREARRPARRPDDRSGVRAKVWAKSKDSPKITLKVVGEAGFETGPNVSPRGRRSSRKRRGSRDAKRCKQARGFGFDVARWG